MSRIRKYRKQKREGLYELPVDIGSYCRLSAAEENKINTKISNNHYQHKVYLLHMKQAVKAYLPIAS